MGNKPRLAPNFTLVASTLEGVPVDPSRPQTSIVIDGTRYFANGWNRCFWADIANSKLWPLGSDAPTTFALALSAAGSPAALPDGQAATYMLVFRNNARQEETAPQVAELADTVADPTLVVGQAGKAIANASGATRDVTITWTDPAGGRWTHADIYKRRRLSSDIVRVASVAIATATYLDVTPDASLSIVLSAVYVPRYRTTKMEVLKCLTTHLGRTIGITGRDSVLRFSQPGRADGELTQVDFPPENLFPVEIDDGFGPVVLIFAHYNTLIAVKREACYLIDGDFGDTSLTCRRMYQGRGALSARSYAAVHSMFVLFDEMGPYGWQPDGEPQVLGSKEGGFASSPLAPLWARVNRGAADMVQLVHREEKGIVEIHAPLDHQPISMRCPVWNYRENRFDTIDDEVSLAAGTLEDRSGLEHDCVLDDIGYLREKDQIVSEGLEVGPVTAGTLAVATNPGEITNDEAAFSSNTLLGPTGATVERLSSAGVVLDENRVLAVAPNVLTVIYWSAQPLVSTQTLELGTLPFEAIFASSDYNTADRKTASRLIPRFTPQATFLGVSPMLKVYSGMDEQAYTLRRTIDMTNSDGWAIAPCWDRGFKWKLKFEARRAADAVEIQGLTADLWAGRLRR